LGILSAKMFKKRKTVKSMRHKSSETVENPEKSFIKGIKWYEKSIEKIDVILNLEIIISILLPKQWTHNGHSQEMLVER
jgi:basic membrane lipoprotein Med (substrate-binding protein (PBP1-ABC) superfamily)